MYVPQTVTGVTVVGVRKSAGDRFVGRASGFSDTDPTGTAALDPTRAQMRAATRRATTLILRAEDELAEAGSVIANGYPSARPRGVDPRGREALGGARPGGIHCPKDCPTSSRRRCYGPP